MDNHWGIFLKILKKKSLPNLAGGICPIKAEKLYAFPAR